ncbi:MAG: hypothetical protein ACOWWO_11075 [Peptococcaceae bacterium]
MNLIKTGMRMIYGTSPLGLVAIGGLLAITLAPTAKKTARKTAVLAAKGALAVAGASNKVLSNVRENLSTIVEEAGANKESTTAYEDMKNRIRIRKRALAVGATKGVIKVTNKVNEARDNINSHVNDLIQEAQNTSTTPEQKQETY